MSTVRRVLRRVALALGLAFAIGFGVGSWLRCRMERPPTYIGDAAPLGTPRDVAWHR
jgi:TRAP-type C4-dicarboxylate transport system permease small subunit